MLSLILTIICSTSIALILKHNETRSGDALVLLAGNYFIATLISMFLWLIQPEIHLHIVPIVFGFILGALFVFSFFSFAKSVAFAGTALATISSRISVVIPTALSILLFKETPGNFQWMGYLLAILTLLLFYFSLKRSHTGKLNLKVYLYLFAVFAGIGINDFSLKLFNSYRPETEKHLFLFSIFLSAFLYSAILVKIREIPIRRVVLLRGALLGLPNMLSSLFLINALLVLPAVLVYPVVNIGIIVLTMIAAYLIWQERLNRFGLLALMAGSM